MAATLAACGTRDVSSGSYARASTKNSQNVNGVTGSTLCLNARRTGDVRDADTYQHIENIFGKGAVEAPSDTMYQPNRPHVLEVAGNQVTGPYFSVIAIEPTDVNLDFKSLADGGDRSRTEIKIAPTKAGPHAAFQGHEGDTFVYTWRFRIAPEMKFSPSFTHIHQIKAYGGEFAEPPLITFTPLANGTMEVRHVGDARRDSSVSATLATVPLSEIQGNWITVHEEIVYSNNAGRYRLTLRDPSNKVVLDIEKSGLRMWRTGADHMRPKWGIYRKHHAALSQNVGDRIDFANFGITRGELPSSDCR